jgi:hypothetical protein
VSSLRISSIMILLFLMPIIASPSHLSATYASTGTVHLNQSDTLEEASDANAYHDPMVLALSRDLETRINKSSTILEITSKLPEVKFTPFAGSISPELHGIPSNADTAKRELAQNILTADNDFEVIFFLTPNGDMYLEQPYSRQANLTMNNFAFRDYYKGATNSHNTYLGDVVISASSGRPQAYIAVPIYSDNNGTLVGLWAGGLNLQNFSRDLLQTLNLSENERIVYVDNLGQKVADSNRDLSNQSESFANLKGFKNAVSGIAGTTKETISGTEMLISYHPVKAVSNTWAVLLIEPYDGENFENSSSTTTASASSNDNLKNTTINEITIQNTSMSKPAAVRHPGQPPHEVVFALPLREDGKVYSGTATFTASKPIEVEVLHTYIPLTEGGEKPDAVHGEPYNAILPGNKSIAITHLRDIIDVPIEINGTGISSGSFSFVGNALVFHKTSAEPFTVTYTIDAVIKDVNVEN